MSAGLTGLLGIGVWIAALILAGVLANLYFIAASNKRPVKVKVQSHAFRYSWPIIFVILGLMGIVELIQRAIRKTRYGTRLGRVGWKLFWGLLFIAIGLVVWFSNIGLIVPGFGALWPFIIVAVGVAIVIRVVIHYACRKPRKVTVIIDKLEEGKIDVDEAVDEIRRGKRKGHQCHE
jgi:MFS family permease